MKERTYAAELEAGAVNEPAAYRIEIQHKAIPASFATGVGAGAFLVAIYNAFAACLFFGLAFGDKGAAPQLLRIRN